MRDEELNSEKIINILKKNKNILIKYGVKKIGLFGSFVRGEQKKYSDIDFIVELENPDFDNFMELVFYLEDLFKRKVELITNGNISPYIKPYIENEIRWYETNSSLS